jgi:hypothetical protein
VLGRLVVEAIERRRRVGELDNVAAGVAGRGRGAAHAVVIDGDALVLRAEAYVAARDGDGVRVARRDLHVLDEEGAVVERRGAERELQAGRLCGDVHAPDGRRAVERHVDELAVVRACELARLAADEDGRAERARHGVDGREAVAARARA